MHALSNIPHLIWGNGGGYLKQGEYVNPGVTGNSQIITTLINAAVQDTGSPVTDFGDGDGTELDAIRA